jgi:SEC-C motif domain protein
MKLCNCCSQISFKNCCQPYISGRAKPRTALALMRSRFTAFARKKTGYIKKTVKPPAADMFIDIDLSLDDKIWVKLKIIDTLDGSVSDNYGEVEFKAYYKINENLPEILYLQERSVFKKISNNWYYTNKL